MSINTTVGAATANSYVTVTEAGNQFSVESSFQEELEWSTLATESREAALISAARQLDLLRYRGTRLYPFGSAVASGEGALGSEQALAFPRGDHPYLNGSASSSSTATVLQAESLVKPTTYPDDFFAGGSVYIRSGSNCFEMRSVSEYDAEAGEVTLSSSFSNTIEAGSSYRLLYPIPLCVKRAQLAQTVSILDQSVRALRLQGYGVGNLQVGAVSMRLQETLRHRVPVCPEALVYLSPYLASASSLLDGRVAAR